jgi:SAM-dependent methyltransferase
MPHTSLPTCPSCASRSGRRLGESSFCDWAETAAVVALRQTAGGLHRCRVCHLVYRAPMPSAEELRLVYASMPVASWSYEAPAHWEWIRMCIEDLSPNNRVLDVGCFRGDFLSTLPSKFERFGIEPNADAAKLAMARGVSIIGREASDELSDAAEKFGAIILMDVAEHFVDPAGVFRHLKKYLAPGGVLLVLTGNSEHWLARRSLPFYWYMSFPIHLVYLGLPYIRWLAAKDGWALARQLRYPMHYRGRRNHLKDGSIGVALVVWRRWLARTFLADVLKRTSFFKRLAEMQSPPLLFSLHDHFGVALINSTRAEPMG